MKDFQKIKGLHGLNHEIIEYSKKEKVITDKRTDRISYLRLDPFCGRGRVKCISVFTTRYIDPKRQNHNHHNMVLTKNPYGKCDKTFTKRFVPFCIGV